MTLDSSSIAPPQPAQPTYANHGYLLDGKSPRQQTLTIKPLPDGVKYRLHADGKIDSWAFKDTDWSQSPLNRFPLYLKGLKNTDSWLVITDAKASYRVLQMQKQWASKNFWLIHAERKNMVLSVISVFVVLLVLWLGWPFAADKIAEHAPASLRAGIDGIGDTILENRKLCSSPDATVALGTLQNRLGQGHPEILQLRLLVSDEGYVNAYTLPGHQVIITRGLLKSAKNSNEVAGVLAHEFGHVLHDHVVRGFLRHMVPKMIVSALAKALGSFPSLADDAIGNAYSREFESQADATAIVLLHDAHISAKGIQDFFDREEKEHGDTSRVLVYFSNHPGTKERATVFANAVKQDATTSNEQVLTDEQFKLLQNVCSAKPVIHPGQ